MQAAVLYSEHEFPKYETVPDPVAGKGELLVKVEATGVNYADTMMRRGFYLQKPEFPFIPGFEFSGTVVRTGEGVSPSWMGRRVMGLPGAMRACDSGVNCYSGTRRFFL
jgi:NADPH2:quinone reductase